MAGGPGPAAGKDDWRRWARRRRREIRPAALSAEVRHGLVSWGGLEGAILAYLPLPDEVDLTPLLADVPGRWLVTRTPPHGPLTVHDAAAPREDHPLGFSQPAAGAANIDPAEIDVALVPGLAFDRTGMRLGRGQGYFDELLARCRPGLTRVGIVPAALVVARLPSAPHDVAMTHLATEVGVATVGGRT